MTERVLKLDADLQQHLVDPGSLDKHARDYLVALESAPETQGSDNGGGHAWTGQIEGEPVRTYRVGQGWTEERCTPRPH